MAESAVTKGSMDCYRVRGGHGGYEWATICIRGWDVDGKSVGEARRYLGEILIYSSFGSWAHQWGHLGCDFRRWLLTAEFDYMFTKFMGSKLSVFDRDGTIRDLFARVIEYRRNGSLNKATARALWDGIDQEVDGAMGEHEFVQRMLDLAPAFEEYGSRLEDGVDARDAQRFLQEPWEHTTTMHDPQAVGFWRDLWPVFIEHLAAELAPQAEVAHG